jgi:hypothetical protein
MSIYMLNKIRTEPEIFGSKVDPSAARENKFSPKFWLWKPAPKMSRVTRSFMFWFFLSWGIDYRKKSSKTKSERMTSWTFNHPTSHCERCLISSWILGLKKHSSRQVLQILNLEFGEKLTLVFQVYRFLVYRTC